MATPISGGTTFDLGAATQAAAAQPQTTNAASATAAKRASKTNTTAYTVKLSDAAQVQLLNTQGQSVSQISVLTDLSTQAVDGYLGKTQVVPATDTTGTK
jgi:hypothetical protein